MKHPELGKRVVPIIPDEARTFGMESLFRQFGIYASQGQLYKPHDAEMFLYYKESKDGQILEEGITEAGSMASFTAAGTAYANYGVEMIPFFIYYSMFGFQRVGDLDLGLRRRARQGLPVRRHGRAHHALRRRTAAPGRPQHRSRQHRAHLHHLRSGFRLRDRHHRAGRHPAHVPGAGRPLLLPDALQRELPHARHARRVSNPEGVLKGIYRFKAAEKGKAKVQLFGSGPILNEALRAQQILAEKYQVRRRCLERHQLQRTAPRRAGRGALEPAASRPSPQRTPYLLQALKGAEGPIVAASDYMKVVADQLAPWLPGRMETLGTDGFGRSDNREYLRRHFEINAESIAAAALSRLARDGKFDAKKAVRPPSRNWDGHREDRPRARLTARRSMQIGQRVAVAGMLVCGALALIKIVAGLAGHSTAVVADGLESAGDVFASGFVLFGLTLAAKPADEEHPYGHGRVETLTGL